MDVGSGWVWLLLVFLILLLVHYLTSTYYQCLSKIPASKAPRFIGHTLEFARHPNEILATVCRIFNDPSSNKDVLAIWAGPMAFVYLRTLEDIEKLLTNNTNSRKSENYRYLKPWLGQGLINSDGQIWQLHRKLITPSFHFKILEEFLESMLNNLEILQEILDGYVGRGCFNIEPYIANYSLDVIAETAMSSRIDAQHHNSNFVESIKSLTEVIIVRSVRIWFFFDLIFAFSAYGSLQRRCTTYVNDFINKIMDAKRMEKINEKNDEAIDTGGKKRLALLDMLFDIQRKNPQFSDKEVLDEVNTFMFAGHDTTTSGISFLLYILSTHQDVQEKVYKEIMERIGDERVSYQSLMSLKYLERVTKETLRLYPSVPYIGRKLNQPLLISTGHVVPKDCDVAVFIYNHHRNPQIWPDPETFDPDRFLPENVQQRHPYAYIPFSAGPRNCIGQKFAMMEMMVTATVLLRRFRLIAEPDFIAAPISHIVLRPNQQGIRLTVERR